MRGTVGADQTKGVNMKDIASMQIPMVTIRKIVMKWVLAERENYNPMEKTITGLENPKTKKQRTIDHSVAVALRETVQAMFGVDPIWMIAEEFDATGVEKSMGNYLEYLNRKGIADELLGMLIAKSERTFA